MFHRVFRRARLAQACIAAVVLRDELLLAAWKDRLLSRASGDLQRMPALPLPTVAHHEGLAVHLPVMVHGKGLVVFAVERVRDEGEHGLAHELTEEDHTTPRAFIGIVAHIETQVHFLEVGVERDGDPL